ncbi:uncharacterized protein LOC132746951 [Ruditapes philippinarum]|uniref:uncharacterized protein LOC132746951 n=1 Tax=Ruditapes philippinarum TaxID=129788 RepID=UPI00295ACB97|nr:uncharacterized protein LOC132746951 [Ruditapes philippinarum]
MDFGEGIGDLQCPDRCRCCDAVSGICMQDKCLNIINQQNVSDNATLTIVDSVLIVCSIFVAVVLVIVFIFCLRCLTKHKNTGDNTEPKQQNTGDNTEPKQQNTGDNTEPKQQNTGDNTEPKQQNTGDNTEPKQQNTGDDTGPSSDKVPGKKETKM